MMRVRRYFCVSYCYLKANNNMQNYDRSIWVAHLPCVNLTYLHAIISFMKVRLEVNKIFCVRRSIGIIFSTDGDNETKI